MSDLDSKTRSLLYAILRSEKVREFDVACMKNLNVTWLGCVIVLTGPTDYISDGTLVVAVHNGDRILGQITGAGCILGSCIASYCATAALRDEDNNEGRISRGDMFSGAIAGYDCSIFPADCLLMNYDRVLVLTIATELALKKIYVKGPGTFLPGLIDTLWEITPFEVMEHIKIVIHTL